MLVGLIVFLTVLIVRYERNENRATVEHQTELMLASLATAAYDLIADDEVMLLGGLKRELEQIETIEAVEFYDPNGRLLTEPLSSGAIAAPFGLSVLAADIVLYEWQEGQLLAGCAIIMNDRRVGGISLTVSTSRFEQEIAMLERSALTIAILSILGGTVVAWLVGRSITEPLRQLVVASNALAQGNMDARADIQAGGEIGDLAHTFNTMADQLSDQVVELEQRVAARTEDLRLTNLRLVDELKARQQSQLRYQALFERTTDAIFLFTLDFVYISVNQRAADLLGYTREGMVGMSVQQVILPEDMREAQQKASEIMQGKPLPAYERQVVHRDGRRLPVEFNVVMVCDENGEPSHFQGIVRDISKRKKAEEALRQSQKLESLGLMSGGIAHDFNNLLTAMLAQSSLIATKLPATSPVQKHVERVVKAARRAADLTQQLLAYSGQGQLNIQAVQLNEVVEDSIHLFDVALPKNVAFEVDLAAGLPVVEGDVSQIQQIVLNLILNAAESMDGEAGNVQIVTEMREVRTETAVPYLNTALAPGHYVTLSVVDNGVGMSKETLLKIFDPFFTTKKTGRGLGLAAVLGIVRSHKGGLLVESELGEGSRFELLFPVGQGAVIEKKIEEKTAVLPTPKNSTVLIIDDEPSVRDSVTDILEIADIETLTASDGYKGVEIYKTHQKEIDLVLLDMSMPGLNGEETFYRLQAVNPDIKVILSSGYSEVEASTAFMQEGIRDFLQKPYSFDKLIETVQKQLVR